MEYRYCYEQRPKFSTYFAIPYEFLKDGPFQELSLQAKFLYGVLFDRMGLAQKYNWVDEENRIYIIYQISQIEKDLKISKKQAIRYLKELEEIGLVEKKRLGFNRPNILYVKHFLEEEVKGECNGSEKSGSSDNFGEAENGTSRSIPMHLSGSTDNGTAEGTKHTLMEVPETELYNQTKYSHTINQTISHHPLFEGTGDEIEVPESKVKEQIKQNLDAGQLMDEQPKDKELIEGIIDLIAEVLMTSEEVVWVGKKAMHAMFVRNRLLALKKEHIQYILKGLEKAGDITNVRQYLITALFNAPLALEIQNRASQNARVVQSGQTTSRTKFQNYPPARYDFNEIEEMEKEYRNKILEKTDDM